LVAQSKPLLKKIAREKAARGRRNSLTFNSINPPMSKKIPPLLLSLNRESGEVFVNIR
jgi:hypothetical protein